MDAALVKNKLIVVLETIQTMSGFECPTIGDTTKPIDDLREFDSKIWPVAIGMLAIELGVNIPDDVNIFRLANTRTALTINETVTMVLKLINQQEHAVAKSA
jgi:hypothetical protein